MDGTCSCGRAVHSRGMCQRCYLRIYRDKNRAKIRGYQLIHKSRHWNSVRAPDEDFDALDILRVATGLNSFEIATYIRALREGVVA